MEITINDLSFMFSFYEEDVMIKAVRRFIYLCKVLKSERCHNVTALRPAEIDKSWVIGPNCSIYDLIQRISDRDERRFFLSLLVDQGRADKTGRPFIYRGKSSYACATAAENGMLVSLESDKGFSRTSLTGKIQEKDVEIANISCEDHLPYYQQKLGLRKYEANAKKHKREKDNSYGKGKTASPMDLTDEEAQRLLDKAVTIKGRLYARKGVHNYAFQETGNGIFHGYIADDLKDDIQRELYKEKWD